MGPLRAVDGVRLHLHPRESLRLLVRSRGPVLSERVTVFLPLAPTVRAARMAERLPGAGRHIHELYAPIRMSRVAKHRAPIATAADMPGVELGDHVEHARRQVEPKQGVRPPHDDQ